MDDLIIKLVNKCIKTQLSFMLTRWMAKPLSYLVSDRYENKDFVGSWGQL